MLDSETELGDQLEDWFKKSVEPLGNLDMLDKQAINFAGGEVYKKDLEDTTREKHYSNHNDKKFGHMADGITIGPGDESKDSEIGTDLGSVYVGWKNHYHSMNAMRLNDGTKSIQADHFKTNLDNDQNTVDAVLKANQAAYRALLAKKGIHLDK